jgi:ADP-heptose:LPS heptosyltransferase
MIYLGGHGLGDELMLTALVREHNLWDPQEMIQVRTKRKFLWQRNTRLNIGNRDNGKILDPVEAVKPDLAQYPRGTARSLGFEMKDLTAEVFLSDAEKAVEYWPTGRRPVAAIDPSAGWTSRAWAGDRWQAVASALLDAGWDVLELGQSVQKKSLIRIPCSWSFLNVHQVRETAAVLHRCDLYLGNDSGLFHLAGAVGTPQVAIFGPQRAANRSNRFTVPLEPSEACPASCGRACTKSEDGHPVCLDDFTPLMVVDAAERAMARFGKRGAREDR